MVVGRGEGAWQWNAGRPAALPPHQHRLTVRCLSVCLWEFWHILRLPLAASNNPADLCAAPLPFWPFIFQRVWFNRQVTIFSVEIFGGYNWSYIFILLINVANYFFRFCVKGVVRSQREYCLLKYKVLAPTFTHLVYTARQTLNQTYETTYY